MRLSAMPLGVLLGCALVAPCWADTTLLSSELNLVGGLYNGEFDLMRSHPQTAVGFDYLHKYADDGGDWATLGLQVRGIYATERNTLQPDLMDAYLNLRGDGGRANWRLGRFELPYGLEPVLDTHGTLLQSNLHHNLGDLWSWGIDLNGQLDTVDYRVALVTGDFSEVWPHHEQGSWLLVGRVGSPRTGSDDAWGISLATGRTVAGDHGEHEPAHTTPHESPAMVAGVDIARLGADYTHWTGADTWMAEGSLGTKDGAPQGALWVRWEHTPLKHDRWTYALQGEGVWRDPDLQDDFIEVSAQVAYKLTPETTVRLLAAHAFDTPTDDPEDRLLLQFYFFGQ